VADSNWLEDALHTAQARVAAVVPEAGAEMKRLGVQGQMELANALFNGNAFVPYGPGQYTPAPEQTAAPENAQPEHPPPAPDHQQERGGMER
jgi:hypothetical protein